MKMLCWGSWRGREQSAKAEMWEETEGRELQPEVALGGERGENSGPGSVSCRRAPEGSNSLFSSLICADTAWDLGQDPTVYSSEDGLLWTLGSHFWHDFQMPDINDAHVSDVLSPPCLILWQCFMLWQGGYIFHLDASLLSVLWVFALAFTDADIYSVEIINFEPPPLSVRQVFIVLW